MNLPPGFELDPSDLPEGFEVDAAPAAPAVQDAGTSAPNPPPGMRGGKLDAVLTGMRDPIDAMAQYLPRVGAAVTSNYGITPNALSQWFDQQAQGVDQTVQGNEAEYQDARALQGREGFDTARLGGNVASPANLLAGGAASRVLAPLSRMARVGAAVPIGAGYGALQPALNPDQGYAEQKGMQAATGAVLGPAVQGAGNVLSSVVAPRVSAGVQSLLDQGVRLTPGQILGGAAKRLEEKAVSIPMLGGQIRASEGRAAEDFNRAAANRALAPLGQEVPKTVEPGRDLIKFTKEQLSNAYNTLTPKLTWTPDAQVGQELSQIVSMTQTPAFTRGPQFQAIIQDKLLSKVTQQGNMNGASFKQVEEGLGKEAKRFLGSADPDQRQLGEALASVLETVRGGLVRSNPAQAARLKAINEGYANFSRLRQAAASVGTDEGVFTPAQLQNAVKAGDKSVAKGRFSEGNALMQDLSETGKAVMGTRTANSGTADRLLAAGLLGGGAALQPNLLAGALVGSGLYTQPGQYLLRQALTARPQMANALAEAISQRGQSAIPGLLPFVPVGQQ